MYMCADVDMYAVCMLYICACPYGGQKSTLDAVVQMLSTFFEIGSLTDLVLTGSPASTSSLPGVQVCTTRPGLHGCMASVSLTEPSPQTLSLFPVTSTFTYSCHIIYVPMCVCLDFPKSYWFLLLFLSLVGSSVGFVHQSGFLGWLSTSILFAFLTPPRIRIRGHPGLP